MSMTLLRKTVSLFLVLVLMSGGSILFAQDDVPNVEYIVGTIDQIDPDNNTLVLIREEDGGQAEYGFDPQFTTVWIGDEENTIDALETGKAVEIGFYKDEAGNLMVDTIDVFVSPIVPEADSLFENINEDINEDITKQ